MCLIHDADSVGEGDKESLAHDMASLWIKNVRLCLSSIVGWKIVALALTSEILQGEAYVR